MVFVVPTISTSSASIHTAHIRRKFIEDETNIELKSEEWT